MPAFLFNFHPVGMGAAIFTAGFDGSGLLNGTAEKAAAFRLTWFYRRPGVK